MFNCEECNVDFSTKASLSTHKYRFHRNMASNKRDTIAIVDLNNKRSLSNGDDIRKRIKLRETLVHSTSGESSDSDSTMDSSDDE